MNTSQSRPAKAADVKGMDSHENSFSSVMLMPHPRLADLVDSYWVLRGHADPTVGQASMYPLGYPMIEFNLGDRWIKNASGTAPAGAVDSNIMTMSPRPLSIRPLGRIHTALARLHPLALYKLMGTEVGVSPVLEAEAVFGRCFRETLEQLDSSAQPARIKQVLDRFFLNAFTRSRLVIDRRIQYLLGQIITHRGTLSLRDAAGELGLSQKRIEQLFGQYVGLSPKAFAGIARFQYVLAAYRPEVDLTTLGQIAGFYDQSHFIRHFKKLADCPPRTFFAQKFGPTHRISNLYNFSR